MAERPRDDRRSEWIVACRIATALGLTIGDETTAQLLLRIEYEIAKRKSE